MNFYNLRNITEILIFYCPTQVFMLIQISQRGATKDTKMSATIYGRIFFLMCKKIFSVSAHQLFKELRKETLPMSFVKLIRDN